MNQKVCPSCTLLKDFSEFHKDKNRKDGLNSYCKSCHNIAYKKSRDKKPGHYNRIKQERGSQIKALSDKYKTDRGCFRCPENDSACLDFHHTDPSKKDITVGEAIHLRWSWEHLLTEIEKCIILCSNCHRKFHAGRFIIGV